jgi:hypothetical protein
LEPNQHSAQRTKFAATDGNALGQQLLFHWAHLLFRLPHNVNQHAGLISQQACQNFNRRAKDLARLRRCPKLINRTPGPDVRAYQHTRLYAKSGGRNWGVKCEIKKHIMDTGHK